MKNREDILERLEKSKKVDVLKLRNETFGIKEYIKSMNIGDARMLFSLRSRMTETVKANFKGRPEYRKTGWKCEACNSSEDTQDHIMQCISYENLRKGKNLTIDSDLVKYFRQVINLRLRNGYGSLDCTGT